MAQSNPTNVVRFLHIIENLKVKQKKATNPFFIFLTRY